MQKSNLITQSLPELLEFQESWNLIGQLKVGHVQQEPRRKTKSIGWR